MNVYFLRKIRTDLSIPLESAAEQIKIAGTNLLLAETGKRPISAEKLKELADVYECAPVWLTDAPVLNSCPEIIYYLKTLYTFDGGYFEIHLIDNVPCIRLKDQEFVDSWHDMKNKYLNKIISKHEYSAWVFSHGTENKDVSAGIKLGPIKRKIDETRGGDFISDICTALDRPGQYYALIEEGKIRPTRTEQEKIAGVFKQDPDFLFANFAFESVSDVRLFLLCLEQSFDGCDFINLDSKEKTEAISFTGDGYIKINIPEIQVFLEKIIALEAKFNDGKLTIPEYNREWVKL